MIRYGRYFLIPLLGLIFLCVPSVEAVEQLKCSPSGCYIPEKGSVIKPLWNFPETLRWYRSIQKHTLAVQLDRIAAEMVKIRSILEHPIELYLRRDLERIEKYLGHMLESRLSILDRKAFPEPTYDSTSQFHFSLQKYPLSCEISAATTIMEALGVSLMEDDFIQRLRFSGQGDLEGGRWGNPDEGFVGSMWGSQRKYTGYGVYEKPIAEVIESFSLATEIINESRYASWGLTPEAHLSILLNHIERGQMVELWGDWCTDPQYEDGLVHNINIKLATKYNFSSRNSCSTFGQNRAVTWLAPDGRTVSALIGEHTFILLGYMGTKLNPSHIIVWDTDTGRHIYPINEWMRKWKAMNYKSLIVQK